MVNYNTVTDVQFNDGEITEPVQLSEAKDFCKIDISTDDTLITALIVAARQQCEAYTGLSIVEHNVVAVLNNCNGGIYIPYGPIQEIFQVIDNEGNILILDSDYTLQGNEFKRLMHPKVEEVTIEYFAGYGASLPSAIKTAILNQVYYLYDNRSQGVDDISPIAKMILNPYRRV